jgi:hypothetical protein
VDCERDLPNHAQQNRDGGIDMKRLSKGVLVFAAILSAVFLANPTVAGRKQSPDPLTQSLFSRHYACSRLQ